VERCGSESPPTTARIGERDSWLGIFREVAECHAGKGFHKEVVARMMRGLERNRQRTCPCNVWCTGTAGVGQRVSTLSYFGTEPGHDRPGIISHSFSTFPVPKRSCAHFHGEVPRAHDGYLLQVAPVPTVGVEEQSESIQKTWLWGTCTLFNV